MRLLGKPIVVMQELAKTLLVDSPVIEHSAVRKKTVNHFANSSIAQSSADASIVEDLAVGQQTANYSSNSSAAVPSTTPEVESSAAK